MLIVFNQKQKDILISKFFYIAKNNNNNNIFILKDMIYLLKIKLILGNYLLYNGL